VFAIFNIGKKLFEKLLKKSYRDSYVAEHVRRGVAYQIRALRDQREWNQGAFAKMLKKPQSVVSRLEDPSYGKYTVQTLLEVASVLDVALQVRFVPYSSFLQQTRDVSAVSMQVPSFKEELDSKAVTLKLRPLSEILLEGRLTEVSAGTSDPPPTPEGAPINLNMVPRINSAYPQ
jgi:transcriptional regulator with XRE-family HTH domain